MTHASIIIPVFNKWDLTRNCLKSIAATVNPATTEVVLVDNASSDVTPKAASFLGNQLFGDSFIYKRNEINRNFAGASNQGARLARGEWLVFLNNDTITETGWLDALLNDFKDHQNIAATGPLLLYEPCAPFGHTIQHLGVYQDPLKNFAHLYRGIPADGKLAKKRRFFQIITAACMAMPRKLFLEAGEFDEGFINGFEDVDLCARLTKAGWRHTVNPHARVVHLEGRSPGRKDHDKENEKLIHSGSARYLKSDMSKLLNDDGLTPGLTPWLAWIPAMPKKELNHLAQYANAEKDEMLSILVDNPYWEDGWNKLANLYEEPDLRFNIRFQAHALFKNPEIMLENCEDALKLGNRKVARESLAKMRPSLIPQENYLDCATRLKDSFAKEKNAPIAQLFENWLTSYPDFARNKYNPVAQKFASLEKICN